MSFLNRLGQHNKYLREIQDILVSLGYQVEPLGYENIFSRRLMRRLIASPDPTAHFLRFQPDLVAIRDNKSMLIEVRSIMPWSKNLTFELGPWEICKLLSERLSIEIYHVFPEYRVIRSDQVMVSRIHVPKRWGPDRYQEIKNKYPEVEVRWVPWKKGSGTPYALIYPEIWEAWPQLMEIFPGS